MTSLNTTRYSLLIRLKDRSEGAWDEFVHVYEHAIYSFCRKKGLQHADASDVTQEVLLTVHSSIADWELNRSKGRFRAWLFTVTRNAAVDAIARNRREEIRVTKLQDRVRDATQPEDECSFDEEYRHTLFCWAANKVREEVHDQTWQAFWRTTVEEQDVNTVAKLLNLSVSSVYTAKCRVLARLRKWVAKIESEDPKDSTHER